MGASVNLFSTPPGRKVLFAALYLSEGAPIGFLWWALPAKLRAAGVPIESITTLLSLLVLPWALKVFWAPLVDTLRSPRWTFRSWILSTQFVMGLLLVPLFQLDPGSDFTPIAILLLSHAVVAATQDVAIDALCISVVAPDERGAINGWMQAGMLTGRSVLGGGALILGAYVGDAGVLALLIAAIWLPSLLLLAAGEPGASSATLWPADRAAPSFRTLLTNALRQRTTWFGLLFAAIAGAGFEAVGAVAGPFLIDRGFTSTEVGWFFFIPVVACMAGGALAGGYLSDRFPRERMVARFLLLMAGTIVAIATADTLLDAPSGIVLMALLALLYAAIGLFTASSYALLMDVTHPRLAATQFSAFMGGTNLCESWSALAVGRLAGTSGYAPAFVMMALASLLALPMLRGLRRS